MPVVTLNPNGQGVCNNWVMVDSRENEPACKLQAVSDNSDAYDSCLDPVERLSPESWVFEDILTVPPSTPVTSVVVSATIPWPGDLPFIRAKLTLDARVSEGPWTSSNQMRIPDWGGVMSWQAPHPEGRDWTVADVNAIELQAALFWAYRFKRVPLFSKLWIDATLGPCEAAPPASFQAGREVAGRMLRLFRAPLQTVKVETPALWPLDLELLDDLALSHMAANSPDGRGWGNRRWQRGLVTLLESELDLERMRLSLSALQVRPYRVAFWDTMVSDVATGALAQGVGRLSLGEARLFRRASPAWIPDPAHPERVVELGPDVEKITAEGTLLEGVARNDQRHSSFRLGLEGWAVSDTAAIRVEPDASIFAAGAQRLVFAPTSVPATDLEGVGLPTDPYPAGSVLRVSIDHEGEAPPWWALSRGAFGWWSEAAAGWVPETAWNRLPVATAPARSVSRAIPVPEESAVVLHIGYPAGVVIAPGGFGAIHHVQVEAGPCATSRIVTEGAPVTRAADLLAVADDRGRRVWPPEHGSAFLQAAAAWDTADLPPGATPTLLDAWVDEANFDRLFYDRDSASLVFRRRRDGGDHDARFPLVVVRGRFYSVGLRWTGAEGSPAPFVLSLLVDGQRGADMAAGGPALDPEAGRLRIGHQAGDTAPWGGFVRHLTITPLVLTDEELAGLP